MDGFVSNYTMRLDSKGRVSIPAPFRAVLTREGFSGIYCCPALDRPALEAGGKAFWAEIEAMIAHFPPYSQERERFATAFYGTGEMLRIDPEGRVALTEPLKNHAEIADAVAFVGLGIKFQIWEPKRFQSELAEATAKVRAIKQQLEAHGAAPKAQGAGE